MTLTSKKVCAAIVIAFMVLGTGLTVLSAENVAAPAAASAVNLTFWHFWGDPTRQEAVDSVIREFEKQSQAKVTTKILSWTTGRDELLAALKAGTGPDLFELGSDMIAEFYAGAYLYDMAAEVNELKQRYNAWEPVEYGTEIVGVPWILDSRVVFYNKEMLKAAGFDENMPPKTWEQLKVMAKKIHAPEKGVYGFGMNGRDPNVLYKKVLPFVWSNGGNVLSLDGKSCVINTKQVKEAIDFYVSLKPFSIVDNQANLDRMFAEGKIAFWISGSWLISRIERVSPNMPFGVSMIPVPGKKGKSVSFAGGDYVVVNKKSVSTKVAAELAKFMCREDNSFYLCQVLDMFVPAAKLQFSEKYYENRPQEKVIVKQLEHSYAAPKHQKWVEIQKVLEEKIADAIEGKIVVDKALSEATVEINELVK
ncbi:MAG: extracellular solute-binding protein [Elusimicrobiota bacterium]